MQEKSYAENIQEMDIPEHVKKTAIEVGKLPNGLSYADACEALQIVGADLQRHAYIGTEDNMEVPTAPVLGKLEERKKRKYKWLNKGNILAFILGMLISAVDLIIRSR